MLIFIFIIFISGCASMVMPGSGTKEEITMASDLVANARKSIESARDEGAPDYSPDEFSQAEQFLNKSEEALKKRKAYEAEDLAFLADIEAKIATANAMEAKARVRSAKARGEEIKFVLEAKMDEAAAAKARQAIAERMMLKARKESDRTKVYSDKEVQKARAELAIVKADLMIGLADQVKASEYAQKTFTNARNAKQKASDALNNDDFKVALDAAEEAEKHASNAYVEAKAKMDSETSESLRARDKAIIALAKAELSLEQVKENRLVKQHAGDDLEKAEKTLKEAGLALKAGDYERAESTAQQTLLAASSARAVAEAKEREIKVEEIQEDAKANALDNIKKLERLTSQAGSIGASEFAGEDYKEAQATLEKAKQAVLKQDFEEAISLAREGITHSAAALAIAQIKADLKKNIDEVEKNIIGESGNIPETTVRKTDKGIIISMTGDIFDRGNKIKKEVQERIKKIADILKKYPNYKIIIEGHTDDKGSEESRLKVSNERAYAFLRYLVEREGITLDTLSSVGYGKSKPIVPNTDDNSRYQNQRIDILILIFPVF